MSTSDQQGSKDPRDIRDLIDDAIDGTLPEDQLAPLIESLKS